MIYLFDSELPLEKSIYYALKSIYGISFFNSKLICNNAGFCVNLKTKDLSNEQIAALITVIESSNLKLSGELKKLKLMALQNAILTKSYKGLRRNIGLPVRGQRTHTNARTARKKTR